MNIYDLLAQLDKNTINTIGVVTGTLGGCLLWYFIGDVVQVNKKEILAGEEVVLTVPSNSPKLRRRLQINIWLSRFGVFLTLFGGILQAISNYMT